MALTHSVQAADSTGAAVEWRDDGADDSAGPNDWERQVDRIAAAVRTDEGANKRADWRALSTDSPSSFAICAEAAQSPSLVDSMLASASRQMPPASPSPYSREGGFLEIAPLELCALLTGTLGDVPPLVVDVREAAEYAGGHIPGSVSVPLDTLSEAARRGALGAAAEAIVVVVGEQTRAAQANVRLRRVLGFAHVYCVRGDIDAWVAAGLPLDEE
jgi:rhodanese-related sulfurtransferase